MLSGDYPGVLWDNSYYCSVNRVLGSNPWLGLVNRPFPNYTPLLTNKTFKSRLSANFSYICCTFSTWSWLDVSVCQQRSIIWKWPIDLSLVITRANLPHFVLSVRILNWDKHGGILTWHWKASFGELFIYLSKVA